MVTGAEAEQHPICTSLVQAFRAGEQQLADPERRIVLAPAMLQGLVLDGASDLVDAAVPDPHDVERVGDPAA